VSRLAAAIFLVVVMLADPLAAQQNAAPASDVKSAPAGQGTSGGSPAGSGAAVPLGGFSGLDAGNSKAPIEIDADDGIEWLRDQNVYIARGNARATRGDLSVTADTLAAHYRNAADGKTHVYMIEADGHVVLVSKTSRIIGDKAIYDVDKGAAIITGDKLRATSKDQYVTARDSLEYWEAQGAVIARGDAVAANPQQQVYADLLTGYFRPDASGTKKLYQVEANGNVRILSKGNVARCLKAVYNLQNDVATLEGGVKITRGQNQLNGERAVYNLKTGQAKITSGTGGRVKTLLVPGGDSGGILKP
jgi:lipopolysaccharide export system protein LptA